MRFVSDNPGIWFMHCHAEIHTSKGMSMVVAQLNGLDDLIAEGLPQGGDANGQICGTNSLEAHDARLRIALQDNGRQETPIGERCPAGCVVTGPARERALLFASAAAKESEPAEPAEEPEPCPSGCVV